MSVVLITFWHLDVPGVEKWSDSPKLIAQAMNSSGFAPKIKL